MVMGMGRSPGVLHDLCYEVVTLHRNTDSGGLPLNYVIQSLTMIELTMLSLNVQGLNNNIKRVKCQQLMH